MIETLRALLIGLGARPHDDALDLIFEQKDRGKTLSVLIYNIYVYIFFKIDDSI